MKRRQFVETALFTAALGLSGFRTVHARARPGSTPDVLAITGSGREVMLRGKDIEDLAKQMQGQVLMAGEPGYDEARWLRNPSFDKHPALIVQPATVEDVQAAVKFARTHELLLAVKCGGHSHSGQSTCDRGMQIDLSTLRGVRVDAAGRRAQVMGGTLLGAVDQATASHGLVTPLGTVSHTGVGGLTLGGGFGRLTRRFGMAIDNLQSVDVVTADGRVIHTSVTDNSELFWGLRGGSGNFGVVTQFDFKLHPMQRDVVAGTVVYPVSRARDVLSMWSEYAVSAPDDLYIDPVLVLPPRGAPGAITLEVCYSGPAERAEAVLAPVRQLGKPDRDSIKSLDYVSAQRVNDATDARAIASYLKSGFISQMSQGLVSAIVDGIEGDPSRTTLLFFQHCGGAASRAPENATAFAHRNALANMMAVSAWPIQQTDATPHIEATRRYWKSLEKFPSGFYVNDMAREATSMDVNANYRGNYERLVALKTKYDPTNLFRLNANIVPAKA